MQAVLYFNIVAIVASAQEKAADRQPASLLQLRLVWFESGGQAVSRSPSLTMMLPADVGALLCCLESQPSLIKIKVREYQSQDVVKCAVAACLWSASLAGIGE